MASQRVKVKKTSPIRYYKCTHCPKHIRVNIVTHGLPYEGPSPKWVRHNGFMFCLQCAEQVGIIINDMVERDPKKWGGHQYETLKP